MALTLLGIVVIVAGFAARLNPLLVVTAAAIVTGLGGGLDLIAVISAFGKAFNENRYVSVTFIVLPVIGALERAGLQERAKSFITSLKAMTTFRILALYMLARQIAVALGLTSLGGQAQMVRPLIAPMAEAAAEAQLGPLPASSASGYAHKRRPPTISASSSARTFSSPSARSCSCAGFCSRTESWSSRWSSPCGRFRRQFRRQSFIARVSISSSAS